MINEKVLKKDGTIDLEHDVCSAVQCSAVQCSIGLVQYSAVQYRFSTVQCSTVQCSAVQYTTITNSMKYSTAQISAV